MAIPASTCDVLKLVKVIDEKNVTAANPNSVVLKYDIDISETLSSLAITPNQNFLSFDVVSRSPLKKLANIFVRNWNARHRFEVRRSCSSCFKRSAP